MNTSYSSEWKKSSGHTRNIRARCHFTTVAKGRVGVLQVMLLFNCRNNGRFPFQLIILLVSRTNSARTGRHLIIGLSCTVHRCVFNRHTMLIEHNLVNQKKQNKHTSLGWLTPASHWSMWKLHTGNPAQALRKSNPSLAALSFFPFILHLRLSLNPSSFSLSFFPFFLVFFPIHSPLRF